MSRAAEWLSARLEIEGLLVHASAGGTVLYGVCYIACHDKCHPGK